MQIHCLALSKSMRTLLPSVSVESTELSIVLTFTNIMKVHHVDDIMLTGSDKQEVAHILDVLLKHMLPKYAR